MKFESQQQIQTIGTTIRSTATGAADRWFKAEKNTPEYAQVVAQSILQEVRVNLMLAGIPIVVATHEIDPTDSIIAAMKQRGFDTSLLSN